MRECKRLGSRVYLVTSKKLENEDWPREAIDDIFFVGDDDENWDIDNLIKGASYLAREHNIDKIVPLDDFDLEKAARLREHLRVAGMGDTRTRYFRDKLAMRTKAQDENIPVPEFVHVLNYDRVRAYTSIVPPPWVLKPRSQASATGISKIHSTDQLWEKIHSLGDEQSHYLLERFVPGEIYHVDSIVYNNEVVFARAHKYGRPPMAVAHDGGIFITKNVEYGSDDEKQLLELNKGVLGAMGLLSGVSHTEFIKAESDGKFYFLETLARVGGAHIAEMLEASSGLNLWREWAKIETLDAEEDYTVPPHRNDNSGLIISLAKQEWPDTGAYSDPEIVWRLDLKNHAGMIVASQDAGRIQELLDQYTQRFYDDFHAYHPPSEKPSH